MIIRCVECHTDVDVPVTEARLRAWAISGLLVYQAFPDLKESDREMLRSAICERCMNKIAGEDS